MEGPHHGPQPPGGGAQLAQSVQEHLAAAAPASLRVAPGGGSHLGQLRDPLLELEWEYETIYGLFGPDQYHYFIFIYYLESLIENLY